MPTKKLRYLNVICKERVSPNVLRVTLGGPGLDGFPEKQDSAYLKLSLPDDKGNEVLRTYTVRNHDQHNLKFDVDFVLHHDTAGPATHWARTTRVGETVGIYGPGPKKLVDPSASWFLLAGDMSALPAISANLEVLPESAIGTAVLEIIAVDDRQDIACPPDFEIKWVVNPRPDKTNTVLFDHVKEIEISKQFPSIWIAGEFSTAIAIRNFLKSELDIRRQNIYASSYWKMGETEDQHKISKRRAG